MPNTEKFIEAVRRFSTTIGVGGVANGTVTTVPLTLMPAVFSDGDPIEIVVDRVSITGALTTDFEETIMGVVSGSNIITADRGIEGTAQAHSAGAVVEIKLTADMWNRLVEGIKAEHSQTGAHKFTQVIDSNGNETIKLAGVASAVNEVSVSNAATNNAPKVEATGGDTNIDLKLLPKGTGALSVAGTTNYENNVTDDDDIPNKKYVDDNAGGASGGQVLDWSNAVLPDTNFPSIGKTIGTNWVYRTLDFDPATDEAAYFYVQIPSDVTPVSGNLILHWTASAGTATQAAYWDITHRPVNNDEVIDATTTPNAVTDSGNDALLATGDEHILVIPLTVTGWAAGDLLQIKISRDANHASDNLSGDAKLIQAFLEVR